MGTRIKIISGIFMMMAMIVPCFSDGELSCFNLFYEEGNPNVLYNPDHGLLNFLNKQSGDTGQNIKELTKNFCNTVALSGKCKDTTDGNTSPDYFDASQSVFLSVLCNAVGASGGYADTLEFMKKKDFFDFNIVDKDDGTLQYCHPDGDRRNNYMNNCIYANQLPKIFNEIMNDMFNVNQARYLGIPGIDLVKSEDAANNFVKENTPGFAENICDSKRYKTTCKKLKTYMQNANSLLKNTTVLNIKKLGEEGKSKVGGDDGKGTCANAFSGNILYCGLLGSSSNYDFINTVYNEYFWYSVFMGYYSLVLNSSKGTEYAPSDHNWFRSQTDLEKMDANMEIASIVEDQLMKSKQAITQALNNIVEIRKSFPLHIGMLMYQEDAKYFMNSISKIYAPIRTLYDKLRNVQVKE